MRPALSGADRGRKYFFVGVRLPRHGVHHSMKEAIMTSSDDQVAAHMTRFLDMLDAFRRQSVPEGLPPRFRDVVTATPRHRFVHRFRIGDGPLRGSDAKPAQDLKGPKPTRTICQKLERALCVIAP
jgi:hypothetical protein